MNQQINSRRNTFIIILISSLLSFSIAEYFLGWYDTKINNSSSMSPNLLRYHPKLGWKLTPNWRGQHTHHDFNVHYSINGLGFRGELSALIGDKKSSRIALIGDSYTFGLGVNDSETFSHYLQSFNPDRRYINLGIPGYSTDQQLLFSYENAEILNADHYILVFYLANDYLDNTLSYPLQADQAKPFYSLNSQQLILNNTPTPRKIKPATMRSQNLQSVLFNNQDISKSNSLIRYFRNSSHIAKRILPPPIYDTDKINFLLGKNLTKNSELLTELLREFKTFLKLKNATFSIVSLPSSSYISAPNSLSGLLQEHVRKELLRIANTHKIPVIDLAKELQNNPLQSVNWFHPNEGHLNKEGHQKIAKLLTEKLTYH